MQFLAVLKCSPKSNNEVHIMSHKPHKCRLLMTLYNTECKAHQIILSVYPMQHDSFFFSFSGTCMYRLTTPSLFLKVAINSQCYSLDYIEVKNQVKIPYKHK